MTTGSRRPWFGIVGIVCGWLALAAAVLPIFVVLMARPEPSKPRDTVVIERVQGIKDRIFAIRKSIQRAEPERSTPSRNIPSLELLLVAGITLGVLAIIFSAMSWLAREPWRLGVTAGALGAGAILIESYFVLAAISLVIAVLTIMFGGL